jgi:hypothetical protein
VKALPVLQDGAGVSVLPQLTQKVKRKPYQALVKLLQAITKPNFVTKEQ